MNCFVSSNGTSSIAVRGRKTTPGTGISYRRAPALAGEVKGDGRVLRHAPLGSEIALDRDVALCAVHRPRPFGLIGSVLERREKFLNWESTIWKFREQPEA